MVDEKENILIARRESISTFGCNSNRMTSLRASNSKKISSDVEVVASSLWLHVKGRTSCYYLYAEYYFEAWVTSTADPNGPRYPVDKITLFWRHGDVRGREDGVGVDMVAKDDRTYATGFQCDSDLCVNATVEHAGFSPWSASTPDGCMA